jgi:hypothetical protein
MISFFITRTARQRQDKIMPRRQEQQKNNKKNKQTKELTSRHHLRNRVTFGNPPLGALAVQAGKCERAGS